MSIDTALVSILCKNLAEEEARSIAQMTDGMLEFEMYRYAVGHLNGIRWSLKEISKILTDLQRG